MERDALFPEPVVYSLINISHNIQSPSMQPHVDGRPTYNRVPPDSPRGSFTMLSLPQCHAGFSMIPSTSAWVEQSPLANVCRSNPQ